ncbi:hypothetical protein B0H13DRAFT_2340602 [Mycena leptocephala]|nr:hypothetical protein B0H13DRAFT_2340602 [Mycena leptocephala]
MSVVVVFLPLAPAHSQMDDTPSESFTSPDGFRAIDTTMTVATALSEMGNTQRDSFPSISMITLVPGHSQITNTHSDSFTPSDSFLTALPTPGAVLHAVLMGERPLMDGQAIATRILGQLERIPEAFMRRLQRLSDAGKEAVQVNCVICWNHLSDLGDIAFTRSPTSHTNCAGVVSLPCAHIFHATCLQPWFSRQGTTTCPTCRFELDPTGVLWYGAAIAPEFANVAPLYWPLQLGWAPPSVSGMPLDSRIEEMEREFGTSCENPPEFA